MSIYTITTYIFAIVIAILGYYLWQLNTKLTSSSDKIFSKIDLDEKVEQLTKDLSVKKAKEIEEIKQEKQSQLDEFKQELKQKVEERNEIVVEKMKLQTKNELQEEEKQMRQRILDLQENIDKRESGLTQKLEKLETDKEKLEQFKEELRQIKDNLLQKKQELETKEQSFEAQLQAKLTEIAQLSLEDAKKRVIEKAKEEMGHELIDWQTKIVENAEEEANMRAREIVALAVQRCSSEVANEFTITTVKLTNEEDKGKLIGKGGRNIQWLEKTLGVELIIDETPEVVTVSGFSSIRRHLAKKTLEKLLADGRVHPSSIEEMHEKAKADMAQEIAEAGQWAVNELGIFDFPPKLIRIIGRLKFRTSYGQNMLKHSVEMAKLAGLLADEINAKFKNKNNPVDKLICIKGALLHDIGKSVDEDMNPKGNHIELGEKICDMFNLDWKIKKCISSHHNEAYYDPEHGFCIEAVIVDACDNISGGRLGARKETGEAYFQRMESLERIAESTAGVTKSWIMRGSREMWVFFDADKVSDAKMSESTRLVAKAIGSTVRSPFEIKVIGFRENRIVEFAA